MKLKYSSIILSLVPTSFTLFQYLTKSHSNLQAIFHSALMIVVLLCFSQFYLGSKHNKNRNPLQVPVLIGLGSILFYMVWQFIIYLIFDDSDGVISSIIGSLPRVVGNTALYLGSLILAILVSIVYLSIKNKDKA